MVTCLSPFSTPALVAYKPVAYIKKSVIEKYNKAKEPTEVF